MSKTILVTGAAGFLGTSLIELLLAREDVRRVVGIDSLLYKEDGFIPLLRNPKFELVIADVRDAKTLDTYARHANVIFPLAALVGMPRCKKSPKDAEEINEHHVTRLACGGDYN